MSKYESLLKKTEVFEKIALYGSRKDFLESIAQDASSELNYTPNPEEPNSSQSWGPPAPAGTPSAPAAKSVNSSLLQAQKDLNALNVAGMSGPLKLDGVMGPETQYALNQYRLKNKNRMPPNLSNDLLYVMIHRDAAGQNDHVNLQGLHHVVKQGPVPHRASKVDQLSKRGQNLSTGAVSFPDETVSGAISSAAGSANNLSQLLSSTQSDSNAVAELSNVSKMLDESRVPSYVNDKAELDAKANPIKTLLGNGMYRAFAVQKDQSASGPAKEMATQLVNEAKKAMSVINSFYRNNGIQVEDLSHSSPAPTQVATEAPKAKPQGSLADAAKNLAASLEASIGKLTTGPQRAVQLGHIENAVKTLQNYFRNLQKSGDLQGYFARMSIVSALQKLYSALEYADLDVVKSLNAGRGVPETPDSKI